MEGSARAEPAGVGCHTANTPYHTLPTAEFVGVLIDHAGREGPSSLLHCITLLVSSPVGHGACFCRLGRRRSCEPPLPATPPASWSSGRTWAAPGRWLPTATTGWPTTARRKWCAEGGIGYRGLSSSPCLLSQLVHGAPAHQSEWQHSTCYAPRDAKSSSPLLPSVPPPQLALRGLPVADAARDRWNGAYLRQVGASSYWSGEAGWPAMGRAFPIACQDAASPASLPVLACARFWPAAWPWQARRPHLASCV